MTLGGGGQGIGHSSRLILYHIKVGLRLHYSSCLMLYTGDHKRKSKIKKLSPEAFLQKLFDFAPPLLSRP